MYRDLVLPLEGTPGRLANDLLSENNRLGSTRIFESVPYRIGKPILEGGIVNSAAGALYSYYVQGETSANPAGAPNLVPVPGVNLERATRHFETFNVKHFIARGAPAQEALSDSDDWRLMTESRGWQLYELLTHDGGYVEIPEHFPVVVDLSTSSWKTVSLDWLDRFDLVGYPVIIQDRDDPPTTRVFEQRFGEAAFYQAVEEGAPTWEARRVNPSSYTVQEQAFESGRLRFRTDGLGLPHIIKMSYYPNWKVIGADRVYRVSPGFMVVYPTANEVTLYFGAVLSDIVGKVISVIGALGVCLMLVRRFIGSRRDDQQSLHTQDA